VDPRIGTGWMSALFLSNEVDRRRPRGSSLSVENLLRRLNLLFLWYSFRSYNAWARTSCGAIRASCVGLRLELCDGDSLLDLFLGLRVHLRHHLSFVLLRDLLLEPFAEVLTKFRDLLLDLPRTELEDEAYESQVSNSKIRWKGGGTYVVIIIVLTEVFDNVNCSFRVLGVKNVDIVFPIPFS